jgi:hypothetical protein
MKKGDLILLLLNLGELFRTLRASQEAQDEVAAHAQVVQVLDYFEGTWTGASK